MLKFPPGPTLQANAQRVDCNTNAAPISKSSIPFRLVTLLWLWFNLFPAQMGLSNEPLNVLVLLADDWRHDMLGCAGHPILETPHLDQLARDGLRFTRHYVTTSVCGVSRATLFTGQWMSRHGCAGFGAFQTPWAETYPGLLRARGYHLGHIGKWHNGPFPENAFDVGIPYGGTHWMRDANGDRIHVTVKNQQDSIQFLRSRPKGKLFCLTLAFFATHAEDSNPEQYLPQPDSMERYLETVIPEPRNGRDEDFKKLPDFLAQEKNEGRVRWKWRFDTPEHYQASVKNYFRLASEVDSICGRILEELKAQNLLDSTMIIFTSDNGYFLGEHGLADKWYPFEESIRVPLIIRDPRIRPEMRGKVCDEMTLNVDLAPTILAAAQLEAPLRMQGRELSALWSGPRKPADWRTEFFYEHPTITSLDRIPESQALVRADLKYIFWPGFQREQLFDLRTDPGENCDLINDLRDSISLSNLRKRFAELRDAAQ